MPQCVSLGCFFCNVFLIIGAAATTNNKRLNTSLFIDSTSEEDKLENAQEEKRAVKGVNVATITTRR